MMTSRRIEMTAALEWAVEFLPHYLTEAPCGFHAELMADLENADKRLIARVAPPLTRRTMRSIAAARPADAAARRSGVSRVIVTHEAGLATGFVPKPSDNEHCQLGSAQKDNLGNLLGNLDRHFCFLGRRHAGVSCCPGGKITPPWN